MRLDDEEMVAEVIVPDHQLSLAIGKEGQNARLAARLSGYKIDIRSESQDLGLDVEEADEESAEPTPDGGNGEAKDEAAETTGDDEAAATADEPGEDEEEAPEAATDPAADSADDAADDSADDAADDSAEAATDTDETADVGGDEATASEEA